MSTVRLETLDGRWETVGVDRLAGIDPTGMSLASNKWGSDSASFTLRREPGAIQPDIGAYTPAEIEVEGGKVWNGQVWETPTREGDDAGISVEGRGWQYHLDYDQYERAYVHTRMQDWVDTRSVPTADLAYFTAAGQVTTGDGVIVLGWPNGATVGGSHAVGVTLDLKHVGDAYRIVIVYESLTPNSGFTLIARNHAAPNGAHGGVGKGAQTGLFSDAISFGYEGAATGTLVGSFNSSAHRYITIFFFRDTGSGVLSFEPTITLRAVRLFRRPEYESGNASILRAHHIVKDARKFAPLLSTSDEMIDDSDFDIPEYAPDRAVTSREAMEGSNAYHDQVLKVDEERRVVFRERPTAPILEVGDWAGSRFEDASANSGEEIVSRVIVEGTGPDGAALRVDRYNPGPLDKSPPQFWNPSADTTDTTGWGVPVGTLVRDTVVYNTSPASWGLDTAADDEARINVSETFQPPPQFTFVKGQRFRFIWRYRAKSGTRTLKFRVQGPWTEKVIYVHDPPADTWRTLEVDAIAEQTETGANLDWEITAYRTTSGTTRAVNFDDIEVYQVQSTLPERRGFQKTRTLPVQGALTETAMQEVGDVYLENHRSTPLKGTLTVARGGARRVRGGAAISPAHLLRHTTELVRLSNRVDPDTGAWGRDAVMASVTWDEDTDTATVALDNERQNFEALLARLAVVVGT